MLEQLAKVKKLNKKKTTIAVQGVGNVGYWFMEFAKKAGYQIVASSNSKGGSIKGKRLLMNSYWNCRWMCWCRRP